jgi:8-hydroxy-5-deazaflavin:NADPH oxidoreductase
MKISILGPGNMGTALALQWSRKGYQIIISHSRNAEKINQLLSLIKGASFEKMPAAISAADVVVVTCQYEGLKELYQYKDAFKNKIVISCVSNLKPDFSASTIGLKTDRTISVAEEIQENLHKAKVGEAFNTAFAANIHNANRKTSTDVANIFYCTDYEDIKQTIEQLIIDLNYQPIEAGNLKSARTLETLATVWVQMAVVANKYPGYELKIIKQ